MEAYEEAGRTWSERMRIEMELWTELGKKLTSTHSVPEAMQIYQQSMTRRMQMAAEDSQKFAADCQKFAQKLARTMTPGGGGELVSRQPARAAAMKSATYRDLAWDDLAELVREAAATAEMSNEVEMALVQFRVSFDAAVDAVPPVAKALDRAPDGLDPERPGLDDRETESRSDQPRR